MSEERRESAEEVREERTPAGDTPARTQGDKNTCPECRGSGRIQEDTTCPMCGGTGKVEAAGGGG